MRIAFDQQVFLLQEYGGISRYVISLARELSRMPETLPKIFAPLHYNRNLEQLGDRDLAFGKRIPKIPKTFRPVYALSSAVARSLITRFEPDIVHETYFSPRDFRPGKARRVITVYDMIHEKFSSTMQRSEVTTSAKRASVLRADHVICISHSTRRDLIDLFDIPEDRISVVHLACDRMTPAAAVSDAVSASISRPYLLYVGSRGIYKNFHGFLRAYASSHFLKSNFSIVSFGGGAFTAAEKTLMTDLGIKPDNVTQIGGGDDVLAHLYRNAEVFVYPSMYEGFGIPALEAMSMDCPLICSNTSSLPEVAGDAAEYFEPGDSDSIRVAIETVVQSPERRAGLVLRGRERNAAFSWRRCATETTSIYRSLL